MISSKHRFRGRRDPRIVLKHGKSIRDGVFQIKYLKNKSGKGYRAAVIVSKKVSKKAPTRNRIRRRVYEAIRNLDVPESLDFIVLVHDESAAGIEHKQLETAISKLLSEVRI